MPTETQAPAPTYIASIARRYHQGAFRKVVVIESVTYGRWSPVSTTSVVQGSKGQGTWAEVAGVLSEAGFRAAQWKYLPGAGEHRTRLVAL